MERIGGIQMKKVALFLLVVVFIAACGKGSYQDLRSVMEEFLTAQEAYVEGMENVQSPEDLAATMNNFADAIEKIGPKMKEMTEKYPEIMKENEMPESLKDLDERGKALQARMQNLSQEKFNEYISDEKVLEAAQRMGKAFQSMM